VPSAPIPCRSCGRPPHVNSYAGEYHSVSCCEIQTKRYPDEDVAIAVWNRWQGQEDRYAFELLLIAGLIDKDKLDRVRDIAALMMGSPQ